MLANLVLGSILTVFLFLAAVLLTWA
ncbi:hypothetical protein CSPAE12_04942 [Colletotrichum incanum]|nr:hypothetical protein CSPAE12_04942 [Colletotrichum incanum]